MFSYTCDWVRIARAEICGLISQKQTSQKTIHNSFVYLQLRTIFSESKY